MTGWYARAGGVVMALVGAAVLARLSASPMRHASPDHALLRLDWRLRGEEAGDCLRPTAEDLARLPVHMRNPDACLGALPPYRLRVWVDDAMVMDDVIRGGGVREDRPLTVYRDVPVTPGHRHIRAEFVRDVRPATVRADSPEPTTLRVEGDATLEAGRVLLMVRRQDSGVLEIRAPLP